MDGDVFPPLFTGLSFVVVVDDDNGSFDVIPGVPVLPESIPVPITVPLFPE